MELLFLETTLVRTEFISLRVLVGTDVEEDKPGEKEGSS